MNLSSIVALIICLAAMLCGMAEAVTRQEIAIRDPFVYCDRTTGKCYLYGTCRTSDGKPGFDVRVTSDPTLQTWSEQKPVWRKPADFWGVWAYWAPEVFEYKGQYYLFATFEAPGRARAVQVLAAPSPEGPFHVHSPQPLTSPEYFSLDGTLYLDKNGDPWMVYSREHISIHDGQMRAVRLKPDLTETLPGTDVLLFAASSATYAAYWTNKEGDKCYLTDGPQMLRLSNGDLVMAWSTNNHLPKPVGWGYTVSIARSTSGEIQGPWVQEGILYNGFAGHGQILRHPALGLVLCVHQPNNGHWGGAYPMFLQVNEKNGKLTMADPATPSYVQAYWRFEDLTPGHPALPSIDILDCSGKQNHLRGDSLETDGLGSSDIPANRIPATKRANQFSYDNRQPAKDAAARYLKTVDKPIDKLSFKSWTVEVSVRPTELGKRQVFISRDPGLSLGMTAEGLIEVRLGDSVLKSSSAPLAVGKWHHVALVCNGSKLRLYVDSKSYGLGGSNKSVELIPGPWTVGCEMTNAKAADQFAGLIDEVRISDKALPSAKLLFAREYLD